MGIEALMMFLHYSISWVGRAYQWHWGGHRQWPLLALRGHREAYPYHQMAEKWICGKYAEEPCCSWISLGGYTMITCVLGHFSEYLGPETEIFLEKQKYLLSVSTVFCNGISTSLFFSPYFSFVPHPPFLLNHVHSYCPLFATVSLNPTETEVRETC